MAAEAFTSALTMVPSTMLALLTVIPEGRAPVANLDKPMAAAASTSALTMALEEMTPLPLLCNTPVVVAKVNTPATEIEATVIPLLFSSVKRLPVCPLPCRKVIPPLAALCKMSGVPGLS